MAEIKSTMDLVMERAARMGRASGEEMQQEDDRKQGMQMAARFLDNKIDNLLTALTELDAEKQIAVRQGMVEALLRNIFLHRDETGKERTEKAANGIMEIGGGAGDLSSICAEIQHILGQYNQHREQLRKQLEEQMRAQYEQVLAQQQEGMQADTSALDMSLQAKVKEEWANVETQLSSQYNQALDQHKTTLRERLS